MNEKRDRLAMAAFKNKLYAFGGYGGKKGTPRKYLSSVETYDPNNDSWSDRNPMSTARESLAASVLGNRIYVCGGRNGLHIDLNSCERYDPEEDKWKAIANMMEGRTGHSLVTVNGRLYASSISNPYSLH